MDTRAQVQRARRQRNPIPSRARTRCPAIPRRWDVVAPAIPRSRVSHGGEVNRGETVHFKSTSPAAERPDRLYRLGYYGGRPKGGTAAVTPQVSPRCASDPSPAGGLAAPGANRRPGRCRHSVSGIYIAKADEHGCARRIEPHGLRGARRRLQVRPAVPEVGHAGRI